MLDRTPAAITDRTALRINPAKTCQPIGAMYASLGLHGCLPHSHGSQGCCSYHRSHLTRHYREPVMAATSSFTEGSAVFGGMANLTQAIATIFEMYNPDIIAVHTTCLSETIGDDIPTIIRKAEEEGKIPSGKRVIHTNTPSYIGSHVTGFSNMTRSLVSYFATKSGVGNGHVNIVPGFVDPSDMREVKRICQVMGVRYTLFPDTSDVLDTGLTGEHVFYPKGGVTVPALESTGDAIATLALGHWASAEAGRLLDTKCGVPFEVLDLPIGVAATDRFVDKLRATASVDVPATIDDERARLLDVMNDMHQYLYGKRVAVFGDPDQVISLVEFLRDCDMKPVYVLTGTPGNRFEEHVKALLAGAVPGAKVKGQGDLFLLHQWIKNEPVDLMIGTTYGKFISRSEDVPLVRFGFPILDRIGHGYFSNMGYMGGIRLLEKVLGALMDRQDRDAPDSKFELVM